MKIVFYSKPVVQDYLRPLARLFAKSGITANQVTVTNIMVSLAAYTIIMLLPGENWTLLLIPLALVIRFILNHVDGIMAVEHHMQSEMGLVLNELADIISDIVLYLPLALISGVAPELVVIMVVLAVLTEVTGILGAVIGAERRQDGPLGKRPRGVLISVVAFTIGVGISPEGWVNLLLIIMLPMLVITSINRVKLSLIQVGEGKIRL